MDVRFHLDPNTGLPHIYGHGVTEDEVEHILRHPGQDRPGRDRSRHALGQTDAGRYLRVIYVPDEVGDGVFVVTAWEMRGNERRSYRRRGDDERAEIPGGMGCGAGRATDRPL